MNRRLRPARRSLNLPSPDVAIVAKMSTPDLAPLPRRLVGAALALLALLAVSLVAAQQQPDEAPAQQPGQEAVQLAVVNPIQLRTEIYIVSLVTLDDGSKEERFTEATSAIPGQVIEYRVFATNVGETTLPAGRVQVTGPIMEGMQFVAGSATPASRRVLTEFSADGTNFGTSPLIIGEGDDREVVNPQNYKAVRWTLLEPLEPGQEEPFYYRVTLL